MITTQSAIDICSQVFGVPTDDILSRSRKDHVVAARAACSTLLRQINQWSYQHIGRAMDRDHQSIMNHVNMIEDSKKHNKPLHLKWKACLKTAGQVEVGELNIPESAHLLEQVNLLNVKMRHAVEVLTQCRSELNTVLTKIEKGVNDEPAQPTTNI